MVVPGSSRLESYPSAGRLESDHKNFDDEENLEQIIILVVSVSASTGCADLERSGSVFVYVPTFAALL